MKFDFLNDETIRILVDTFYGKVKKDENLAPVFTRAIGESDAEWKPHLQHMYDFWSSVMLSSGRYSGNPMQKHRNLPEFPLTLFDRWLELFEHTAQEIHTTEIALRYITTSRRIAESLKLGLLTLGHIPHE